MSSTKKMFSEESAYYGATEDVGALEDVAEDYKEEDFVVDLSCSFEEEKQNDSFLMIRSRSFSEMMRSTSLSSLANSRSFSELGASCHSNKRKHREEVVDATIDMFLEELCEVYCLERERFRNFLLRATSEEAENESFFDPEQWVARYCRHEARRCPPSVCFFVSDTAFKGWLLKKGRINRSWKRRFFWLDGNQLKYAVDDHSKEPRGFVELLPRSSVAEVFDNNDTRRVDLGFAIKANNFRTCYLRAQDPWHQRAWVAILRCTINCVPDSSSETSSSADENSPHSTRSPRSPFLFGRR